MARMAGSASVSGAYRAGEVGPSHSSQPAWTCASPRSCPARPAAVAAGHMRVAGPVGEGMVAAVDGDPADDLALKAHDTAIASMARSAGTAVIT